MAGSVGDDELALVRGEKAVGDVNRDALLALGGEAIDQQRQVNLVTLCTSRLRIALDRRELVVVDQFRVVQQTADQRRFAVINGRA